MIKRRHDDSSGNWQHLDLPTDAPRYAAIARTLRAFDADGRVLDVGCGTGLLRRWLPPGAAYTGLDPSLCAIELARQNDPSGRFIQATAESFHAENERFSCIVFNEVLYYMMDPVRILQKYSNFLQRDGAILCSIYQKSGNTSLRRRMWRWLMGWRQYSNIHCSEIVRRHAADQNWCVLDERMVEATGASGGWHIWLARPSLQNESPAPQAAVPAPAPLDGRLFKRRKFPFPRSSKPVGG